VVLCASYTGQPGYISFLYAAFTILLLVPTPFLAFQLREMAMLSGANPECRLGDLQARLSRAQTATPDLILCVVAGACRRAKTARIDRLIESGALIESTLALVELELPLWKLCRMACEEGVWLCTLTKSWNVPDWLCDTAEFRHESLPLAILGALIEARRLAEKAGESPSSVPRCPMELRHDAGVCCDNFA
jgi:hypothetical protein